MASILSMVRQYWFVVFFAAAICAGLFTLNGSLDAVIAPVYFSIPFFGVGILLQTAWWLWVSRTWIHLVSSLSHERMALQRAFVLMVLQNLGKYLPGKIWGMIARIDKMRNVGVSTTTGMGATYLEQLYVLHSGVALSGLLVAGVFPGKLTLFLALASVASIPAAALLNRHMVKTFFFLLNRFRHSSPALLTVHTSTSSYICFLGRYTLAWLLSGLIFASLYLAFVGGQIDLHIAATLILANTIGFLAGFVALFAPGGIGVREAASVGLLSSVLPLGEAVTLSVVARLFQILSDLLSAGIAGWVLRRETVKAGG